MPKQKNVDTVSGLKTKLDKAVSVVITDYRGLTHKQLEDLHRSLKKVQAEYLVVKNSLLRISSQDTGFNLPASDLAGPTAALFAYEDEIAPLKELSKVIKTLTLPKIKFGFIGGQKYDAAQIEAISKLPAKDVLRAQLLGSLVGPLNGLAYTLNFNLQKLVYVLGQIKK